MEARLVELLVEELGMWEVIRELTKKQAELIAADDMEAFEGSITHRESIIEKIKRLHQESDVLMQSYVSFADSDEKKTVKAIDDAAKRVTDTIAECIESNGENMEAAREKAEGYMGKISKLSRSRKSIGAYAQNVPNSPELFDKKT